MLPSPPMVPACPKYRGLMTVSTRGQRVPQRGQLTQKVEYLVVWSGKGQTEHEIFNKIQPYTEQRETEWPRRGVTLKIVLLWECLRKEGGGKRFYSQSFSISRKLLMFYAIPKIIFLWQLLSKSIRNVCKILTNYLLSSVSRPNSLPGPANTVQGLFESRVSGLLFLCLPFFPFVPFPAARSPHAKTSLKGGRARPKAIETAGLRALC